MGIDYAGLTIWLELDADKCTENFDTDNSRDMPTSKTDNRDCGKKIVGLNFGK
jgi:hypothetical protein